MVQYVRCFDPRGAFKRIKLTKKYNVLEFWTISHCICCKKSLRQGIDSEKTAASKKRKPRLVRKGSFSILLY